MSGEITTAVLERAESHAVMIPAYTFTARVLHWTTAFLILLMIPLGIVIANDWGGAAQDFLYDLHRSLGVTIIPLVILRIIYRWRHPPLPLPDDIVPMQKIAADATHWALYALLIAAVYRLDRHIGISGACRRLRLVRAAADLAAGPRILRQSFRLSRADRHRDCLPCGRAYRRGALPSFCAQGSRPPPHDQRLTKAQTDPRRPFRGAGVRPDS